MICYRCNHEAGNAATCPVCGADLGVFLKIKRMSNLYYNDGLQKAEVRNLSGAIISLKKSLKFNKYNIDARNLLGLVYYEMGEVVDALSEWVISKSYQQDDNIAGRYLEELRENRAQLDAINQTIKKYNQALLYCKQDSRDLAIIQLKKVLSLNPKLVRGHQLLALLYLQEDKLEQAKKTLRSAGKIDANNTITLRYLKEVNAKLREKGSLRKKKEEDLISYQSGNETIIMPSRFQDYSFGSTLGYLLIGLIIGALGIGFLVIPGVENKAKQDMKDQMVQVNDTLSSNAQQIQEQTQKIAELEAQIATMQGQAEAMPEQTASYDALLSGYVAYIANDYLTAGASLEKVDAAQLSTSALELYNSIWPTVSRTYYEALYNAGYNSYNAENFAEAINSFLPVVTHDMSYKDGSAAYYLAQCYRKSGNMEAAKPYYQYVIDNYPGTQQANTSMNYMNGN
ncbi:MAG: tetratricopeptide repeat protein [Agathobacter sp.]|nr:tetratricopeptide repeat protein [Agathobacter sp.]